MHSERYSSYSKIRKNMRIINRLIASLLLASSLTYADVGIDSVGVNMGYKNMASTQNDKIGSIILPNQTDEDFFQAEAYVLLSKLIDDSSWKPSLNYAYATNDELSNQLFMVGINKYFYMDKYNLYAGLLVGTGWLDWKYQPISGTQENDSHSKSMVGAIQVGAEYPMADNFLLGVDAKYYRHNYLVALEPTNTASAELTHDQSFSIAIGIRYSFVSLR